METIELTQDMIVSEDGKQDAEDFLIESKEWNCYEDDYLEEKGLI